MTIDMVEAAAPVVDERRPWPGLDAFTEAQSPFFFGRDADADELFRRVRRDPVTLLFGESGLGKTSLLQAGLFPRLRWADFLPISIRLDYLAGAPLPAVQVRAAMEREVAAADLSEVTPIGAEESLWGYFHRADRRLADYARKEIVPVLVFDQFEEIFTQGLAVDDSRAASQGFLGELAELCENRPPEALEQAIESDPDLVENFLFDRRDYRIVLALREDFLASLESLRARAPSIGRNRYRLRRMTGRQGLDAILNPAPGLVPPEVAQEIVRFIGRASPEDAFGAAATRDTAEGFEIEPPLLSLVCRELNERRITRGLDRIGADLLAGSRDDIIEGFYKRSIADQPDALRAFVEDRLLSDSGFRESITLDSARRALRDSGVPAEALDELVRGRLLRTEERLGIPRVEIIHDVLTPVIRKSRDTRHLRQAEVAVAEREAALHRERQRVRRAYWLAATMALLVVITISVAGWGWRSKVEAERQRNATEVAKADADRQRNTAEVAKVDADRQRDTAIRAERDLRIDEQELRAEARRARQQLTDDQTTIEELADAVVEERRGEATIQPLMYKSLALMYMRDDEGSIRHLDAILRLRPDYLPALGYRGAAYLIVGKPENALRDIKKYLEFGPDMITYGNLGIAEAMRGNYSAAIDAYEKAIVNYHGDFQEGIDTEVAPDIQAAMRHAWITSDGPTFLNALRYEIAVLHAFRGDPEFESALRAADGLNYQNSTSAYLLALNWSWYIDRAQPDGPSDYGVLAARGALWERTGAIRSRYYDVARQYYQKFEKAYADRPRPEYIGLAHFVAEHLDRKEISGAETMPSEPRDPSELAAEAYAAETDEERLGETIKVLEEAHAEQRPQGRDWLIGLYLRRAQLRYGAGDRKNARGDAERILEFDPHTSAAHRLRADDDGLDDDTRRREYQQAVDDDPFNADALWEFADFLEAGEPQTALRLLLRRVRLVAPSPGDYEKIANLQLKLGQKPQALASVKAAIAIASASDRSELYQLRDDIESAHASGRGKKKGR